jgi:carotenoid cleavage dioxygenase-like enzyme
VSPLWNSGADATSVAAGLYAPTSEEHFDSELPVHGDMPPSMNGVYVRVGPVRLCRVRELSKTHYMS